MKRSTFTVIALMVLMFKLCCCQPEPQQYGRCGCKYREKLYNLLSLGSKDSPPRFNVSGGQGHHGYHYIYMPCWPKDLGKICEDGASLCRKALVVGTYLDLGDYKTMKCELNKNGHIQLEYNSSAIGILQTSVVELVCDPNEEKGKLSIIQEKNPYHFRLTHKCCCPDGCLEPTEMSRTEPVSQEFWTLKLKVAVGVGGGIVVALSLAILLLLYLLCRRRRNGGELQPLLNRNGEEEDEGGGRGGEGGEEEGAGGAADGEVEDEEGEEGGGAEERDEEEEDEEEGGGGAEERDEEEEEGEEGGGGAEERDEEEDEEEEEEEGEDEEEGRGAEERDDDEEEREDEEGRREAGERDEEGEPEGEREGGQELHPPEHLLMRDINIANIVPQVAAREFPPVEEVGV